MSIFSFFRRRYNSDARFLRSTRRGGLPGFYNRHQRKSDTYGAGENYSRVHGRRVGQVSYPFSRSRRKLWQRRNNINTGW